MKQLSFKMNIFSMFIAIILITIVTSYFSVNYYISNYIYKTDTTNIKSQVNLIKDNLIEDINNKIILTESLNFGLAAIKKTQEKTGFNNIVKVVSDLVFTPDGSVDDSNEAQSYIDQVENANGSVVVSDVFYDEDKPLITITVPRQKGIGDIFFIDLSQTQALLEKTAIDGSYMELLDANNNVLFSNKKAGDLIPLPSEFDVGGQKWSLTGYIDKAYIQKNTDILNNSITIALLVAVLAIIPLSIAAINMAFKPIVSLRNIVTELSQGNGDLSRRLDVYTQDDLGKIAAGINQFIANLQEMMLDVAQSSHLISSEINQLREQTDSNQTLLTAHSEETEQVVTAITEMSSAVDSAAQSAASAAKLTQKTNNEAEQSKIVVQEAVQSVSALVGEMESMSESIVIMNNDASQIGSVLGVIGDIAEQTNLLALNAAIEAARAGEQGRGFAVVADEVRALAARTQQSTTEINHMLAKLQNGTSKVVSAMETTKASCQHTAENTTRVMDSLDSMTGSVVEINDLTAQIAASAEQQSTVTVEINRNMTAIREMINNINHNGQETVNSTHQLNQTNTQLHDVVGRFKLS
ncbi:methyl-accepting chemotaxis protein [Photobacterium sp.]|uniref:methyl-accepting chemotaxis protein n=1 Tax=Photobacterium sp. TaxID=660 RepID=UPI00299F0A79|nr:methyl-accepting chemotaxis protein [Photobacterium sp.]MDX1304373.1 methyl-accepting chemotaxis protein [Photobacterium sp.]